MFGTVFGMTGWDPDGSGPLPEVLVIGGYFALAGPVPAGGVATWDPVTGAWAALGGPFSSKVNGLATDNTGALVVVGNFTTVGGVTANGIARWDGTAWQPMGSGVDHFVSAVTTLPNGDLVIAGDFTVVDGVPANRVARWDGAQWWPLGAGLDHIATSVTTMPNGDIVVGGYFANAGGAPASQIARWNGSSWSALGAGTSGGAGVLAVAHMANGDVIAGGLFTQAGGNPASRIARWDGAAWSPLGSGINGQVASLCVLPGGDLLAGGDYTSAGGVSTRSIARWDGVAWSTLDGGMDTGIVHALHAFADDDVIAGGHFFQAGQVGADRIARWDGSSWSPLFTGGIDGHIYDFAPLPDGRVVAVGAFRAAAGQRARGAAIFDGTQWQALGGGLGGGLAFGRAVVAMPDGTIVASAFFNSYLATWDGVAWQPFVGGPNQQVRDLIVLPNGDLLAVGDFKQVNGMVANGVARWDGTQWHTYGNGVADSGGEYVATAIVLGDGSIVVGGLFDWPGSGNLVRWDGSAWQSYAGGTSGEVMTLALQPDGVVVCGGAFSAVGGILLPSGSIAANRIARFDGVAWSAVGAGTSGNVFKICNLPGGELLVAGAFGTAGGGFTVNNVARVRGNTWLPIGSGLTDYFAAPVDATAADVLADGTVVVGGRFMRADGNLSLHFARLQPTCPATVVSFGPGCSGSGGQNVLAAITLPWLGDEFRAEATGLPANGLAVAAYGFATTSLPLSSLLPQGGPGCELLTSADAVALLLPTAGRVTTSLQVPNAPSLVGAVVHHQVLPVELDQNGAIVEVTASNRLTLTVGDF